MFIFQRITQIVCAHARQRTYSMVGIEYSEVNSQYFLDVFGRVWVIQVDECRHDEF